MQTGVNGIVPLPVWDRTQPTKNKSTGRELFLLVRPRAAAAGSAGRLRQPGWLREVPSLRGERRQPPPVQHSPLRAGAPRREPRRGAERRRAAGREGGRKGGGMTPRAVSSLMRKQRSMKPAVLRPAPRGSAWGAGGKESPAAWMLTGALYPGGQRWARVADRYVSWSVLFHGRHAFLVRKLPLERSFVGCVACVQSPGGRQDAVCWVARSLTLQSKVNNHENNKFQLQTPVSCSQQPL